jgi:NDP-hexose 4-ketoreductase
MTRAVVFASQSFLGRAVCTLLDRLEVHTIRTARGSGDDAAVHCDVTDRSAVAGVLASARPDWIVQCAGATRTDDARQLHELHVRGTLGVLSASARHAPQARVLLFGSAAEYGRVSPEDLPIREEQPARPVTSFGVSKLEQTRLAARFAHQHGLRVVTVRPFNVLGPGLPEHYFAAATARRLLHHRSIAAPGPFGVPHLGATRDFVDVRDVAQAIVGILNGNSWTPGQMEIYNIATGMEVSLKDVASTLGGLAGGFVPEDAGSAASRGGIERSCGDATRLRQAACWTPRWSWQESVTALWEEMAAPCGRSSLKCQPGGHPGWRAA